MSRWMRIPTKMDKNLKMQDSGGISKLYMKLSNLQYHVGGKMDLERLIICVLMMSGHLNSAFVASDNIRSHTELWFSNQSIPLHYHMCYSPCYDVMSMLVSLLL